MSTSMIRAVVGSIRRNSDFRVLRTRTARAAAISDARRAGAHQDESQEIAVAAWIFFCFGLFECLQNLVTNGNGIHQGLQAGAYWANSLWPK